MGLQKTLQYAQGTIASCISAFLWAVFQSAANIFRFALVYALPLRKNYAKAKCPQGRVSEANGDIFAVMCSGSVYNSSQASPYISVINSLNILDSLEVALSSRFINLCLDIVLI